MFPHPPLNCKKFPPPPLSHTILSLTNPSPASSFLSPAPFPHPYGRMSVAHVRTTASAISVITDIGKHWLPCFGLSVTTQTSVSLRYFDDRVVFLHSFCYNCSGRSCFFRFQENATLYALYASTIRRR